MRNLFSVTGTLSTEKEEVKGEEPNSPIAGDHSGGVTAARPATTVLACETMGSQRRWI